MAEQKGSNETGYPAKLDAYEKRERVGADLWRGVCIINNKENPVVIKVVSMGPTDTSKELQWQASEWSQFSDIRHLLQWRQIIVEETTENSEQHFNLWIIYKPFLTSLRPLVLGKRSLDEQYIKVILRSLTSLVNQLHQRDYILTDIGLDNISLTESGQVLLSHNALPDFNADFDIWRPPGIDPNETSFDYDAASDIWAVGMVSLQLAFGADYVKKGEIPVLPKANGKGMSEEFVEFIAGCTAPKPEDRFSAEQLLSLKFLEGAKERIAKPQNLLRRKSDDNSEKKEVQQVGRFLVTKVDTHSIEPEPTIILKQASDNLRAISQIKQHPLFNVPVETYVGETDTHHTIVLRTLPGTQVHVNLEGRTLVIKGTLPPLAMPSDIRLSEKANSTFEKRLQFSTSAQINPNECTMSEPSDVGAILIKIGKFQSREIGSITVKGANKASV